MYHITLYQHIKKRFKNDFRGNALIYINQILWYLYPQYMYLKFLQYISNASIL